jgi:hypothetical protein
MGDVAVFETEVGKGWLYFSSDGAHWTKPPGQN